MGGGYYDGNFLTKYGLHFTVDTIGHVVFCLLKPKPRVRPEQTLRFMHLLCTCSACHILDDLNDKLLRWGDKRFVPREIQAISKG